jgi:quinol monooxygenase YgiN
MILEIADIRIQPGQQAPFEAAIQEATAQVLAQAKGCRGYKVHRSQESPERYVLQVVWDRLEDHTVGFRQSPALTQGRALIGPFFAAPPTVEHFEAVTASL